MFKASFVKIKFDIYRVNCIIQRSYVYIYFVSTVNETFYVYT